MTPPRFTADKVLASNGWRMVVDWQSPHGADGFVVGMISPEYSTMADLMVEQLFALAKTSAAALLEPPPGG